MFLFGIGRHRRRVRYRTTAIKLEWARRRPE